MKTIQRIFLPLLFIMVLSSCQPEVKPVADGYYDCELTFSDSSALHPKAGALQSTLDQYVSQGLPGAILLLRDQDGLWVGSAGYADIGNEVPMQVCHRHMVASISKPFTATVIFKLVEEGKVNLEQKATDFLKPSFTRRLANADQATLKQMLAHTSGIPDYLDPLAYNLSVLNQPYWKWEQESVMRFAFGKPANNEPGEAYYYSNSNYTLLGMIIEKVTGLSLGEAYQQYIFAPLQLEDSYYGIAPAIPNATAKGYLDLYSNGEIFASEFMYENELRTGDGGIATTAYDLMVFFESLLKGEVVSDSSLSVMTDWFQAFEPPYSAYDQPQNGHGLEYFITPAGDAIGHTGGIFGYSSVYHYFPDRDVSMVLLINGIGGEVSEIDEELTHAVFDIISQ